MRDSYTAPRVPISQKENAGQDKEPLYIFPQLTYYLSSHHFIQGCVPDEKAIRVAFVFQRLVIRSRR
jgi:hypothetical protein